MSGMGKPGDEESYVYDIDIDTWKASPVSGPSVDNFSTQSIITRLTGSDYSRIDRLDYVRLSGSVANYTLWSHEIKEYDCANIIGSLKYFANAGLEFQSPRYAYQEIDGLFYKITGSIVTVNNSIQLARSFNAGANFSSEMIVSGNFINLNLSQNGGVIDWASDIKIQRLSTDVTTQPSHSAAIVTDGLILHLDAGDSTSYPGSGATWYDISGNAKHATLINSPVYSSANGGILTFTAASSQYAEGPYVGSSLSQWSMCVWAKVNANIALYASFFSDIYTSQINYTFHGAGSGTQMQAGYYNGSWRLTSAYSPSIGSWYNFVVTFDGTTLRMIVNNTIVATATPGGASSAGGSGYRVARRWDVGTYIDADIPIAMLYNRVLTADEITTNYNSRKSRYGL
jgi:hypothetical protein